VIVRRYEAAADDAEIIVETDEAFGALGARRTEEKESRIQAARILTY